MVIVFEKDNSGAVKGGGEKPVHTMHYRYLGEIGYLFPFGMEVQIFVMYFFLLQIVCWNFFLYTTYSLFGL